MPSEISSGARLRAWERAAEWPLAGAAVVSAICLAEDPGRAAAALRRAWDEGGRR